MNLLLWNTFRILPGKPAGAPVSFAVELAPEYGAAQWALANDQFRFETPSVKPDTHTMCTGEEEESR